MSGNESSYEPNHVHRFQVVALCGVIALAALELIGWVWGWQLKVSAVLRCVPMAPSTSICFILLALPSLIALGKDARGSVAVVHTSLASFVVIYCGFGLVDYWGQAVPYIEDRLFTTPGFLNNVPLGRMSPLTAGMFILSGGAMLPGRTPSATFGGDTFLSNLSGVLGSIVTFGGFTILLGYVYGTPFLYGGATVPVAATTAAAFLLIGAALLIGLPPGAFPKRYFRGSPVHTRLLQVFVPLVFFAVLLQGIVSRFVPVFFDVSNALLSAFVAGAIAILAVVAASKAASVVGSAVDDAEASLAKSIKEWELTFNTVSDLIMILDNDHRIVRANEALAKKVGLSPDEVVGRYCYEVVHSQEAPPSFCPHSRLIEDGREHGAEFIEPHLGATLDGRVFPLIDEKGQVFGAVNVIRDITERKQAEEELRETTDTLNSVFHASPDAIVVLDPHGVVRMWNRAAERIFGWSADEVLGRPNPVVPQTRKDESAALQGRVLAGESFWGHQISRLRKDGKEIEISLSAAPLQGADGKIWGLLGVMTDISERKKAEAVQRRLATAVEQSIESIMITDPSGRIEYVNPAFERISGYDREEVVGRKPRFLKSDELDPDFYREMETVVRSGKPWKGRLVSRRKDGKLYHEDVTISPVRNTADEIVNYVDVGHDVTQQVLLQKQLFQAQKMEAIGTLAGGVAHDFNNLLQIVLGYSELVLLNRSEENPGYQEISAIRQAAARGADLVQQILTFSRRVQTKPRPLDLNREIRRAQTLLARTIPKMVDIRFIPAEDLKTINADPGQLEQVLLNLAVNAQHAMPEGGTITISTKNVVIGNDYTDTHFGVQPGEYALLTFSDTGHGMEKDVVEHIFEPFYSTKGPEEGTGLGLAMVFGIVTGHNGHVACYSEPGEGTTFRIYLPVIESAQTRESEIQEAPPAPGTETILLVDDEPPIVDLGKRILSRAGYTVYTASRGQEALEIYRAGKGEIRLVILDLIMPEMGGKECFEELLKIDPNVRVIFASGYSPDKFSQEGSGRRAAGFLGKPYRLRDMLQLVRSVLDANPSGLD